MALVALSNGIAVEHMLDRTLMPEQDVEKILTTFFDCITGGHRPLAKSLR